MFTPLRLIYFLGIICSLWIISCRQFTPSLHNSSTASINFQSEAPSVAKATLGRYLFYDRRLSVNGTKSCASCHSPEFSFTDNYTRSIGATGELILHNSKPLINLVFNKYLTYSDSTLHNPGQQINKPMYAVTPIELGIRGNETFILKRIINDSNYSVLFANAFPATAQLFTMEQVQDAISTFVRNIVSFNSPYDKYLKDSSTYPLTTEQKAGRALFFSDKLKCGHCHGGINFNAPQFTNEKSDTPYYFNIGLYNVGNRNKYPLQDRGLITHTHQPADDGAFLVPTLRNLAFTAPYYHDGTALTLQEVIAGYMQGGRVLEKGLFAGDGRKNKFKHPFINGFNINSQEQINLINFLLSLSDSSILKNPAYANPFTQDETVF